MAKQDKENKTIQLRLADLYPLRLYDVSPDEYLIHLAANDCIKDTYDRLATKHPSKSVNELWALTAFYIAAELLRIRQQTPSKPLVQAAEDIAKRIDVLLAPKEEKLIFN